MRRMSNASFFRSLTKWAACSGEEIFYALKQFIVVMLNRYGCGLKTLPPKYTCTSHSPNCWLKRLCGIPFLSTEGKTYFLLSCV